MKKLSQILLGWWFWITGETNYVKKYRMKICATCDKRKWFVCSVCGCGLPQKTSLIGEFDDGCPHPNGPKWHAIGPSK